ncbi:MazG-like family protein [Lentzea kentuckyensis]|jgi:NTP pyrophosphatase (non-canonical NTP hydrolase)|uniref:MazG-like family protein n=1 Tax=Lentzea kentuckyensis TaxID=360086 RepID=UPI000A36B8CC|nr:MazG-like family protein [Lentzea kentuckyensis]
MDITRDPYWQRIANITRWLDDHPACYGDALQWRVGKIAEELGEAHEAMGAMAGQNPRKLTPNTRAGNVEHLAAELADVIVTASVALFTLTPSADRQLTRRLNTIHDRITTKNGTPP